MMRDQKSQAGIIGGLILLLIVCVGIIVWHIDHKNNHANVAKSTTSTQRSFSSAQGKFSITYPAAWSAASKGCGGSVLLLGGNSGALGKCATEDIGQISISSNYGDNSGIEMLTTGYDLVTYKKVTVNGIAGYQEIGVANGQASTQFGGNPLPDGTKVVKYVFHTPGTQGRTYVAIYTQRQSYPDVLNTFDHMVTQNWQFR